MGRFLFLILVALLLCQTAWAGEWVTLKDRLGNTIQRGYITPQGSIVLLPRVGVTSHPLVRGLNLERRFIPGRYIRIDGREVWLPGRWDWVDP